MMLFDRATLTKGSSFALVVALGSIGTALADPAASPAPAPASDASPISHTDAMPDASSLPADVAREGPLAPIPPNSWAYDAVQQLVKDGIITGYPGGSFNGDRPLTRYEAAVLSYRALQKIESEMEAGKNVTQADVDADNKLMASYGTELKAVETHLDAVQKQLDTTTAVATQASGNAAKALGAIARGSFHAVVIQRTAAFNQNVNAVNGPTSVTYNGKTFAPNAALPGGIGITSPVVGPSGAAGGLNWGNQPFGILPTNNGNTGNIAHGLGFTYLDLDLIGNPEKGSAYEIGLEHVQRYSSPNGLSSTLPAYCTSSQVPAFTGQPCFAGNNTTNADGVIQSTLEIANLWYEYKSPGGIYGKVGKFQQDEGPKNPIYTQWNLVDFVDGGRIGYSNERFNGYVGYGFGDSAATNLQLYGQPTSQQLLFGEADYQFGHGRTDVGATYTNYFGSHSTSYDPYAALCTAPGATPTSAALSGTIPLTSGQNVAPGACAKAFGAGYTPITNAAGKPVTGNYISAQAPNDTVLGAFFIQKFGKDFRFQVEASTKVGKDLYTGKGYDGAGTFFSQLDYGPLVPGPNTKGKNNYEAGYWAVGLNGLGQGTAYYGSPYYWTSLGTDWSGYRFVWLKASHHISDSTMLGLTYTSDGTLPGLVVPAGSPQCPGCYIRAHTNALFGEFVFAF